MTASAKAARRHRAYLGLGANIGDPPTQLKDAIARIDALPNVNVTSVSSILVNPAWGVTDQPHFHNLVLEATTTRSAIDLLRALQQVERDMGRVRTQHWGPRLIDIDIVAFDRQEIDVPDLKVPHPYAAERDFVISPLRQVAPEMARWLLERARQKGLRSAGH